MSKRNQRFRETGSSRDQPSRLEDSAEAVETASPCTGPSPQVRWVASALICAHFTAILVGLSANLSPSYLQGQLTAWLAPYLVTMGQSYQALPLELTHAEPFDFPLWVELLPSDEPNAQWQPLLLPDTRQTIDESSSGGLDQRFSRWANYSRLIRLIATEQPESEILSDIAVQLVRNAASQSARRQRFQAIRLVAPKVLSYDEDAQVASGQLDLGAEVLAPTIVFEASVLEAPSGELSLVPSLSPLRTAKPLADRKPLP